MKSYRQGVGKGAFGIKEIPLHTTPKEIKPVSNCSGLIAREGGRRRVRVRTRKQVRGFNRSRAESSSWAPRALLSGALGKIDHCARCASVPNSFRVNLHMPKTTFRPSAEPCTCLPKSFLRGFALRANRLEAGRNFLTAERCGVGVWTQRAGARPRHLRGASTRLTRNGGDVLESKRFGGTTERAKRRLRQTELGRADTRTRGSVGVVGVGETSYATRRFGQARQAKRSLLSTRESRNDHRSVRVGRCVGRPGSGCASICLLRERRG